MTFYKYLHPSNEIDFMGRRFLWRGTMCIVSEKGRRVQAPIETYMNLCKIIVGKVERKWNCLWTEISQNFVCTEGSSNYLTAEYKICFEYGKNICKVIDRKTSKESFLTFEQLLRLVGIFELSPDLVVDENGNFYAI